MGHDLNCDSCNKSHRVLLSCIVVFVNVPSEKSGLNVCLLLLTRDASKLSGPVNGDECYFWRTTGCYFAEKCRFRHLPESKGIDLKRVEAKYGGKLRVTQPPNKDNS